MITLHLCRGLSVYMCMHMLHGPEQDPDYIVSEPLWVTKAKDKTYFQGIFGTPRQNILVVDITEKGAPNNRREFIERIAIRINHNNVTKEQVKSLRDSLLSKYDEHLVGRPSCVQKGMQYGVFFELNVARGRYAKQKLFDQGFEG